MRWVSDLKRLSLRLARLVSPGMSTRYHALMMTCLFTGVLTGVMTWLLDVLMHFISHSVIVHLNPLESNGALIWLPTVGMLLTVVYVGYIVKQPLDHGTARLIAFLKEKKYDMPPRLMWSSTIASSLTLGFGGSAGAEGPSAYSGAAIGSNVGRLLRLDKEQMGLIIGIGAGAGIAGIFRSPIGGVLFTLEVLRIPVSTLPVIALIAACLTSGLTSYLLAGSHFDVTFSDPVCPPLEAIPWILLLGLVCGLYSGYYAWSYRRTGRMLDGISNRWIRAITSGLMVGLAIYIFPTLYATGYDSLDKLLSGDKQVLLRYSLYAGAEATPWLLVVIAIGVAFAKSFASSATNYGGVAGDFAPTIFAGGFLGFAFAMSMNLLFEAGLNASAFVFLGMAGAMGGIIRAPLMAIFLIAEVADEAVFLWPLAIVSVTSWAVRKLIIK